MYHRFVVDYIIAVYSKLLFLRSSRFNLDIDFVIIIYFAENNLVKLPEFKLRLGATDGSRRVAEMMIMMMMMMMMMMLMMIL